MYFFRVFKHPVIYVLLLANQLVGSCMGSSCIFRVTGMYLDLLDGKLCYSLLTSHHSAFVVILLLMHCFALLHCAQSCGVAFHVLVWLVCTLAWC
jgi:hypothetical protein